MSAVGEPEAPPAIGVDGGEARFPEISLNDVDDGADGAKLGEDDTTPTYASSRGAFDTVPGWGVLDGEKERRRDHSPGSLGTAVEPEWSPEEVDTTLTSTAFDGGNIGVDHPPAVKPGPPPRGFKTAATSTTYPPSPIEPAHISDDKEIDMPIKQQLSDLVEPEALPTVDAGRDEGSFSEGALEDGGAGVDDVNVGGDISAPTDGSSRGELDTVPDSGVPDDVKGSPCDGSPGSFCAAVESGWSPGEADTAATSTTLSAKEIGGIHGTQNSSLQLSIQDLRRGESMRKLLLRRQSAKILFHDRAASTDRLEETDAGQTSTSEARDHQQQWVEPGDVHGISTEDHASSSKHEKGLVPSNSKRSVLGFIGSRLQAAQNVLIDKFGADISDIVECRAHLI